MSPRDPEARIERSLRQLGTAVVPVEDAVHLEARRARHVHALSDFADRSFERRRMRQHWLRALAAAAALFVASLLAFRSFRADPPRAVVVASASVRAIEGAVRVGHGTAPLGPVERLPCPLGTSDRIATAEGGAGVQLASGAAVELGPQTNLVLGTTRNPGEPVGEHLEISGGRIALRVPKLGKGSLVVTTPNARVTVHGTAFTVAVRSAGEDSPTAVTTVSVTEGRVSVQSGGREIFLGPGASWSSGTVAAAPAAAPESPVASAKRPAPRASNTLSEENRLFRAAVVARAGGEPRRAVELLSQLLSQYPTTPLAEEARAERGRALNDVQDLAEQRK